MTHPPETLVQELQPGDAAQILSIMADGAPGSRIWSIESLREEIEAAQSLALRDAEGAIVAFIFLRDAVDAFEISYLATDRRRRQQGAMRGLLTRTANLARASGRPIWLEVHEQNGPARKLYETFGFKQTGRRAKYYPDGGAAILYNYG